MQALRKINNNVAVCRDSTGREMIAVGKGIGFGTLPREISLADVERTFYDVSPQYIEVLRELPDEVLALAVKLVDIARNELPYELGPNVTFTLADHIAFAIERARKQIHVRMPLALDVEQQYPLEYKLGRYAVQRIQKELHIGLPNEEATGIAFNLLNSRVSPETEAAQARTQQDADMLEEITEIVENHFCIMVEREGFNYTRYATHLQYLFQRIHTKSAIQTDNLQMYESLQGQFPDVAECVDEIAAHIQQKWSCTLSEEEKLYLILHVNRICIKE